MLEAANGTILETAFAQLVQNLIQPLAALVPEDCTVRNRAFGFRLHSRLGCALHQLLRMPHDGHPYLLFKILLGDPESVESAVSTPACMHDELAHAFFARYPADSMAFGDNTRARATLQVLADICQIDIAQLESRHAAVRRLTLKKSLHTWVADFQQLASDWTCRTVAAARATADNTGEKQEQKSKDVNDVKKKKRKGGGGAYRAFLHFRYKGQRATPQLWAQAAREYWNLSSDERAYYQELGRRASIAWRAGFRAFATNEPAAHGTQQGQPGTFSAQGAIIAADRPDALRPVVMAGNDLAGDLSRLVSLVRKTSRQRAAKEREDMQAWQAAEQEFLAACGVDSPFEGMTCQETFWRGQARSRTADLLEVEWMPPIVELAQATAVWS